MKTIFTTALAFVCCCATLQAQYTTIGEGNRYTLTEIAELSNGVLIETDGNYHLTADLTIAASDTLHISQDGLMLIDSNVLITVFGALISEPQDMFTMRASDEQAHFQGIRFEDESHAYFSHTHILYGGGIRVLTDDFYMTNSEVSYQNSGISSGGAISFSKGQPYVGYSTLQMNDLPAFSSGANQAVGARFYNNTLYANTMLNQNRPQINMGASGPNDTLYIVNNSIIGLRENILAGGISASSLLGLDNTVHIEGNTIKDNRYGITVIGAASRGVIFNNIIEDNDTQNIPAQGGSGISLSASGQPTMDIVVYGNQFRRNLWGITVINQARINLGDGTDASPGGNIFSENGNGGEIYALYNNTAHPIEAQNNCWIEGEESGIEEVENVIVHQNDIASLGLVNYTPFLCSTMSSTDPNVGEREIQISPNPAKNFIYISNSSQSRYEIFEMSGKLLQSGFVQSDEQKIFFHLKPGKYIVHLISEHARSSHALLVK